VELPVNHTTGNCPRLALQTGRSQQGRLCKYTVRLRRTGDVTTEKSLTVVTIAEPGTLALELHAAT
jgi:hypothetical protein